MGFEVPRSFEATTGFTVTAPGRYELGCRAPIEDRPWYHGPTTARTPWAHFPGGQVPMVRESDTLHVARIEPDVPATAPLVPVWLAGRRKPPPDARPFILAPTLASRPACDIHAHIGHLNDQTYTPQMVLSLARASGIRAVWVSHLDGTFKPHAIVNPELVRTIEAIASDPAASDTRLHPVFWVDAKEPPLPADRQALETHRFVALKLHPILNGYRLDGPAVTPWLEIADRAQLPVIIHTDVDALARPRLVAELARRHRGARFVMAHLGLWGAHEEAFECLRDGDLENLYGDLAWLQRFDLLAEELSGGRSRPFVFGTDAPVDGEDSYQQYLWILWAMGADRRILETLLVDNPSRLATRNGP